MTATLEPTPESVTNLMLDTFTGIHRLGNDLYQVDQAITRTRHAIGAAVASTYKNRRTADAGSREEIMRKYAYLQHREGVAEVLRLGIEHYLSEEVETVDIQIGEALQGKTVEARVHIGMERLEPFDRRNGMHGQPRHEAEEMIRGKFFGVSSAEGRLELEHPIEGVVYGVQVIKFHRGLFRPIVDLAFQQQPKLSLIQRNSRSHSYAT